MKWWGGSFPQNPLISGVQTFPGDSLTLDSGSQLMVMGFGGATLNFPGTNGNPGLILNGGSVVGTEEQSLMITGQISVVADSSFGRGLIIAAQLVGSGNLTVLGGNGRPLDIRGANNPYSGSWIIQRGYLKGTGEGSLGTGGIIIGNGSIFEINYDIQGSGPLTFSGSNSLMILHQDCQFGAVTINGSALASGTYTYAQLAAQFPGNFAAGGSGSITIPASLAAGVSGGGPQASGVATDDAVTPNSVVDGADASVSDVTADVAGTANISDASVVPDTTAPALSSGVIVSATSATQVAISWNASSDPSGVGYNVYRNGVFIGTTTTTSYIDNNLSANTQYCYTVVAYDGAGNTASPSAQACVTTQNATMPLAGPVAEWYGPFASWGNVKTMYGAAGDGVTDDSAAIQAALTAVSTGTTGSTNPPSVIYFPKGTYRGDSDANALEPRALQYCCRSRHAGGVGRGLGWDAVSFGRM